MTENGFKKALGPVALTAIGLGAIIGAGIFVVTGQAAAQYAGPAIIISFLIAGLACVFAGLCYAELASMFPVAGSAYTYAYASMGRLIAWVIGWDLMLEYIFGASLVAVGWSGYVTSALKDFGIIFPAYLCKAPLAFDGQVGWQITGAILNLPAMFIVGFIGLLLILGIRESASVNAAMVVVKISVIILFVTFAAAFVKTSNWIPFIPDNAGHFGQFGWSGILRGAAVVFVAYIGFDVVSSMAQEAKNPKRNIPIGILGSLAIATILYIAMALILTGLVKYNFLNVEDPVAVGINAAGESLLWLRPFIKIGIVAGLSSVILVLLLGQPRILYKMAKDGFLPEIFSAVHPKFQTPHITTLFTATIVMAIAGLFPMGILVELVSVGTLFAFGIVCSGVLVLRYAKPNLPRPFRAPLVPFVPILGILIIFVQMLALPTSTWLRLIVWMIIGLLIYFFYGRHRAKEKYEITNA